MKPVFLAVLLSVLAGACAYKHETTVERPAPATPTVVVPTPAPGTSTTVVTTTTG